MKKWCLFLSLYLTLCLLAACGASSSGEPVPGGTPSEEPQAGGESTQGAVIIDAAPWMSTYRIVSGAETGILLLAEQGEEGTGIYTLDTAGLTLEEPLRDGQLINVYFETTLETYPAQLEGVTAVEPLSGGFDDLCALYLRVLEDLWAVDAGLNESGVAYIGVDLSGTSLPLSEQSAVAWAFAAAHDAQVVQGTWDELVAQGYITAEPISAAGSGADLGESKASFFEWKDGCHFSITEKPIMGSYSLRPIAFDAQKWRSSLGAYFFSSCTSVQAADGTWSGYQIGSEMIS